MFGLSGSSNSVRFSGSGERRALNRKYFTLFERLRRGEAGVVEGTLTQAVGDFQNAGKVGQNFTAYAAAR